MKILIADDSAVLRMAVTKLLQPEGYEVVAAADGVEGITQFYEERPDLVLLDVQMPKLNGYVVCRLIKEDPIGANVPVLILTGVRNSAEDRYWGAKSGADGYLTKEALGDELLAAIRSALATRALRELSRSDTIAPSLEHESDVLTRVCEMLDRHLFEATVVNEITAVALQPVGLDGTAEQMLTALRRLVAFDAAAIVLPEDGRMELMLTHPVAPEDAEEFQQTCAAKAGDITAGEVPVEMLKVRPLRDVEGPVPDPQGWGSIVAVPLRARGRVMAVLVVGTHRSGAIGDAQGKTLRTVTPSLAAVLDSARSFQRTVETEARAAFSSLL